MNLSGRKRRRRNDRAAVEAAYRLGGPEAARKMVTDIGRSVRCPECTLIKTGRFRPCRTCLGHGVVRPHLKYAAPRRCGCFNCVKGLAYVDEVRGFASTSEVRGYIEVAWDTASVDAVFKL